MSVRVRPVLCVTHSIVQPFWMLAINDDSYHAELKTKSEANDKMDTHLDSRGQEGRVK